MPRVYANARSDGLPATSFSSAVWTLVLLIAHPLAAQENLVGKQVVLIRRSVDIKSGSNLVGKAFIGDCLTVSKVNGGWLWIEARRGYVKRGDIVPLSQAVEYFTRAISRNASSENYMARGKVRLELKDYERSISDETEAIRRDPQDPIAYMYRAMARLAKQEHDKAIADFGAMIARLPNSYSGYSLRGDAYWKAGRLDNAISDYTTAINMGATAAEYSYRGQIWVQKGAWDRAISDLEAAIARGWADSYSYHNRGAAWKAKGELERAIQDFSKSISLDTSNPFPFNERAAVHVANGEPGKAIPDYEAVVRLAPNNPYGLNAFAWLLATGPIDAARNAEKAVAYGSKACELTKFSSANEIDTLAAAYAEAGNFDRAVELQRQAIGLVAESQKADFEGRLELYQAHKPYRTLSMRDAVTGRWNREADAKVGRQDYSAGRELYQRVLDVDPKNLHALLCVAGCSYEQKDYEAAIEEYGRAHAAVPKRYEPLFKRGRARAATGNMDEAICDYTRAISQSPTNELLFTTRAAAYEKQGDLRRSIVDYTIAIRLAPDDQARARLHENRAEAWLASGDPTTAIADYLIAARLRPREPGNWRSAAVLLATVQDDTVRDLESAIHYAARACELTRYKQPEDLAALAVAYAARDEFETAARLQKSAVSLVSGEARNRYLDTLTSYLRHSSSQLAME